VRKAVLDGEGDAPTLLSALEARSAAGTHLFPYLRGPKVGPMWIRMLAWPGGAEISRLDRLPVAVDVQVRKVAENLGLTTTAGRPLEAVRSEVAAAWAEEVAVGGISGPDPLGATAAGLDPAIWFFGKWGCTFCEQSRRRLPIANVCRFCRYGRT
jgi:hypothetical protein